MWIRRIALSVLLALAAVAALGVTPTYAARHGASSISAHASDPTPRVGEEFVLRGLYLDNGDAAAGLAVKVQTYRDGSWQKIEGAKVTTDSDGRYRVRLILFIRGVRDLRVVGVGADHHAYHRLVVEVRRSSLG